MQTYNIKELEALNNEIRSATFTNPTEFQAIRDINACLVKLVETFALKEKKLDNQVIELTQVVQRLTLTSKNKEDLFAQREALETDKKKINQRISQLEAQIKNTKNETKDKTAELQQIEQQEEAPLEEDPELVLLGNKYDLFVKISNIKWDYEKPSIIAGTVYLENNIKPFEFNKDEYSDFEITNKLWDLMSAE